MNLERLNNDFMQLIIAINEANPGRKGYNYFKIV